MKGRSRIQDEPFTFGYIGTHIPAKGVNHLIESFGSVPGNPRLRIWGRDRGVETEGLKALARSLPDSAGSRIEWMGEYRNQDIVADVFNRCDAIVVPSIWAENSPLVIHEALQARVPVITADYGGMAEYVRITSGTACSSPIAIPSLPRAADAATGQRSTSRRAAGQKRLRAVGRRERPGYSGTLPCGGEHLP